MDDTEAGEIARKHAERIVFKDVKVITVEYGYIRNTYLFN